MAGTSRHLDGETPRRSVTNGAPEDTPADSLPGVMPAVT